MFCHLISSHLICIIIIIISFEPGLNMKLILNVWLQNQPQCVIKKEDGPEMLTFLSKQVGQSTVEHYNILHTTSHETW